MNQVDVRNCRSKTVDNSGERGDSDGTEKDDSNQKQPENIDIQLCGQTLSV